MKSLVEIFVAWNRLHGRVADQDLIKNTDDFFKKTPQYHHLDVLISLHKATNSAGLQSIILKHILLLLNK